MKSKILLFSVLVSLVAVNVSAANNNEVIILDTDENTDVVQVLMQGNGEACNISINGLENLGKTTCKRFTNTNGIKVICTANKKLCKTESEVLNNIQMQFFSANSAMHELQMQHEVEEHLGEHSTQYNNSDTGLKSLMHLPVGYLYPNGATMIADKHDLSITVSEFTKYAFKDGSKISWEELGVNQYLMTSVYYDKFKSTTLTTKILFMRKDNPSFALMHRCLINGEEYYMNTGLSKMFEYYTYAAQAYKNSLK